MMFGNKRAFTLVELIVVLLILGVLSALATHVFSSWVTRYNTEEDIKRLYGDLMRQRSHAIAKSRIAGIRLLDETSYIVTEDIDDNGTTENLTTIQMKTRILWNGNPPSSQNINFNTRGLASQNGVIRAAQITEGQYDCIVVFATRINMGKWNSANNNCEAR